MDLSLLPNFKGGEKQLAANMLFDGTILEREPGAMFGQIKYDNHFKRFCYRGKRLVNAEFSVIAVAHNIRKMIAKGYCVCSEVAVG